MIKLYGQTDTTFTSNGDVVILPLRASVHKEDNGEYYKMTLTNSSYPNEVYTITKIPGGQTYTAGTGVSH